MLLTNIKAATMNRGYGLIEDAAILIRDGRIAWVGRCSDAPSGDSFDCQGRLVTPGLIDCHTHLVYGGNRANEFERRLTGVPYAEIARQGGGILATVRATRAADEETLLRNALPRLDTLLSEGVTTIEIKSGYGLDIDTEAKMLRVARALGETRPVTVKTSFLGAHALPQELKDNREQYLNMVCNQALPQAFSAGLVDAVDAFCEGIAFSVEEVQRVFEVARALGLPVKLHAEQLSNLGGARMAASFGALSVDHIEYLDEQGVAAIAASGTVAVTGGSGFIGSNVVDALIDSGRTVRVIDTVEPHRPDVEWLPDADILDVESLLPAVEGTEAVFHLAAMADVNDIYADPARAVALNVQGTVNVLEAGRRTGAGRTVLASTVWVYGSTVGEVVDETTPFTEDLDRHLYITTKISSEFACRDYLNLYDRPFTVLRYGIPYGPRMRETTVMSAFFRRALSGEAITIDGDGMQSRNFVFVEDLAQAHVLALRAEAENQVINVDGPVPVTIRQVAELTAQLAGDVEVSFGPSRPGDLKPQTVRNDKALDVLGWKPEVGIEDGMARSFEWYRANRAQGAS